MTAAALLALIMVALAGEAASEDAQPFVDAASPGETVLLEPGDYDGPLMVWKSLAIASQEYASGTTFARIRGAGSAGVLVTVDAPQAHVALQRIHLADAAVGARVLNGTLELDGVEFENVTLAVHVADGAFVLDETEEAPHNGNGTLVRGDHRYVGVRDPRGGVIPGARVTLVSPAGDPLAAWTAVGMGEIRAFAPRMESRGESWVLSKGYSYRVSADGYESRVIPMDEFLPNAGHTVGVTLDWGPLFGEGSGLWDGLSPGERRAALVGAGLLATAGGIYALLRRETGRFRLHGLLSPLVTRLVRSRLLEHETRERVHRLVQRRPGKSYREIQRELGLPNGVIAHHLRILTREGLLRSESTGYRLRFFPATAPRRDEPAETADRVLAFVREHPGAAPSEIADAVGITPPLVSYHLARLERDGRLRRVRQAGRVRCFPGGESGPQP